MDYLPPERPAIVAQASERLLAENHQPIFSSCFGNLGMMDTLPETGEWMDTTTWKQRMFLHELKPGQRFVFAKPQSAAKPLFYIDQHKPCSAATFNAFQKFVHDEHMWQLNAGQLQMLRELLGERAVDKSFHTRVIGLHINNRPVLMVQTLSPQDKTLSEAILVVADKKQRLIQEIGYEGAIQGESHWAKQASDMLMNIELKPEK